MKYRAALFDMDGTLIESTNVYKQAALELCARHGIPIDDETFLKHGGKHLKVWLQEVECPEDLIEAFVSEYRPKVWKLLGEKAQWREGAEECVRTLAAQNFPRAVVTMANRKSVEIVNAKLGLSTHIPIIIDNEHIEPNFKPRPHGLWKARLDIMKSHNILLNPAECLYIGDQEVDVLAAQDAGMEAVLIPHTHTHDDAHRDDIIVIDTHAEILKLLS